MSKWKNVGDVNFMDHGGYMVKPHWTEEELMEAPDLKNEYDVFYFEPLSDGTAFAGSAMIDVDDVDRDSWIDKDKMLACLGYEGYEGKRATDIIPADELAVDVAAYYGVEECPGAATYHSPYPGPTDYIISIDDAMAWIKELGIEDSVQ